MPALRGQVSGDAGYDLKIMNTPSAEPGKASNPEAVPLTDEQQRSNRQTIDDAREAELAVQNSAPTKILGWFLIGGFCLLFIGGFFRGHVDFGSLLLVLAGWAILQGSASWLRFVTLMVVPAVLVGIISFLGSIILRQPVEIAHEWVDFRKLDFWLLGVSPGVFLLGVGILAIVATKSRKIHFWTKAVKIYTGIVAVILMIVAVPGAIKWQRERALKQSLSTELKAARSHMLTFGATFSSSSMSSANLTFEPLAKVIGVDWKTSPRSQRQIYRREGAVVPREPVIYSEMLQLPSGDWGELEMILSYPQNP
jgi:hypothetical protein